MEKMMKNGFKLYTVAQMREAERLAETEFGIPLAKLMERAGHGLAAPRLICLQNRTAASEFSAAAATTAATVMYARNFF